MTNARQVLESAGQAGEDASASQLSRCGHSGIRNDRSSRVVNDGLDLACFIEVGEIAAPEGCDKTVFVQAIEAIVKWEDGAEEAETLARTLYVLFTQHR